MNAMTHAARRGALGVAAATIVAGAFVPIAPARARRLPGGGGDRAILLRYRFAPGQRLTYQVAYTQLVTVDPSPHSGSPGNLSPFLTELVRGGPARYVVGDQEHERVVSVDAAGNAHIALSADHLTVTLNGQPQPTSPPAALGVFTVAPDGTQLAGGDERKDADRAENGPILPTYPVAPGAHWTTHLWLAVPGAALLVRHVASEDTLAGFGQVGGEPVAIIDARIPLRATATIMLGGEPARVAQSGLETQRFFVGLDSGLLMSSQGRIVTHVVIHQGGTLRETYAIDVAQRRISYAP